MLPILSTVPNENGLAIAPEPERLWGSDAIAALLRAADIPYVVLNPGASFRGLHDSLVNFLGNERPRMLLCLHEDHVISIAQGYAKVTGKPLLTVVHSNVGLMHASMGIFNAWCDRMPMVVIGANGPMDAMKRRPWIDWIHTTQDQGALVRSFTKWDDQPSSIGAALESIVRALQIAQTPPYGPTYVCLDAGLQESLLEHPQALPDMTRYAPPAPVRPLDGDLTAALDMLGRAKNPFIIAGRVSRSVEGWSARIALAERLGARVVTDRRLATSFPNDHPLYAGTLPKATAELFHADAVLSLDALDLGGTIVQTWGTDATPAKIISCSQDRFVHNGWSKDHQRLPAVDLDLAVSPDVLVSSLLDTLRGSTRGPVVAAATPQRRVASARITDPSGALDMSSVLLALRAALAGRPSTFIHLPLGADVDLLDLQHPLDYLGQDGGGGLGSGPGIGVGAALALRGTSRFPVTVIGDGDYLMGVTALWTAVANDIPLLVVITNNRSYFNDAEHQQHVALERGRPVERKWIGQRLDGPALDLAGFARDQGARGFGPVRDRATLEATLAEAIRDVDAGKVCIVDVFTPVS
jgi:thiamine pyrophosphate-dependent acetolactate synthase large subunit-like protein